MIGSILTSRISSRTPPTKQKTATKEISRDYGTLFDAMEETFDYGGDTREAERDIRVLSQKMSAAAYKAEFQILAAKMIGTTMRWHLSSTGDSRNGYVKK